MADYTRKQLDVNGNYIFPYTHADAVLYTTQNNLDGITSGTETNVKAVLDALDNTYRRLDSNITSLYNSQGKRGFLYLNGTTTTASMALPTLGTNFYIPALKYDSSGNITTEWRNVADLAPINSPALTGTPTAPTATAGANTTQIATTAFVNTAISGKEDKTNKVTSLSSSSTDTQYPSAKCVYDAINADAPYIIESTNGVAEKSVALIQTLYYQTTSNIALRYNGKLYPFVAFYDSSSMAWGGDIRPLGQNRTYINIIKLVDKNLSSQNVHVDLIKSVEDNSDASNLTQYYARKADNGITLTLDANGSLGISTLNGVIGPASWGYADLDYFVTGKTVYNAIDPLAPKASPAFTGTPTAPTATAGTNTTLIATTAFVLNVVDSKVRYVANLLAGTVANYITEPEVKTIKINGSTTNSASTNNCVLLYDTTNKCLKFIFN